MGPRITYFLKIQLSGKLGGSLYQNPIARLVKNPPAMQETPVPSWGGKIRWKGQATHSSILGLPLWLSW